MIPSSHFNPSRAPRRHGRAWRGSPWDVRSGEVPAEAIREAFRVHGFVVIREVLNAREVREVRAALDAAFASPHMLDIPVMCQTELLKHAQIWSPMFNQPVVHALRAALGPQLSYHQDLDVQRNCYGQTGWKRHTGWHMDSGSEGANAYLRAPEYRFAKCGIFLQDFDNGWGGGIRIKPKSHRSHAEQDLLRRRLFFARRAFCRAASIAHMDIDTFHVPLHAGDFCFFDSRLLHSSVPPSRQNIRSIGYHRRPDIQGYWRDVPSDHTKYVIYWDASNSAMVQDFLDNSVQRAASERVGMTETSARPATFTRILAMSFPADFPEQFVSLARTNQIDIVSLSAAEAEIYKAKLRSMQLIHP
jgi:hypothetical protein